MKCFPLRLAFSTFPHRVRAILGMAATVLLAQFFVPYRIDAQTDCCLGRVGDANGEGIYPDEVTLVDIMMLVDAKFISESCDRIPCLKEADVNLSGGANPTCDDITLLDIMILVDFLFISNTPLETCGDVELTFAQREAVFNAVDSVHNSLDGGPADSVAMALAAFLNTLPEIDSAGVIDSVSVWAWFIDGRIISIPNNRFPDEPAASYENWPVPEFETFVPVDFVLPERRFADWNASMAPTPVPAALGQGDYELPHSIQARVISTLGSPCFAQSVPIIKKLLDDHGYLTTQSSGTVSSLFNVDGDGVFYMDAHGGPALDSRDTTANLVFAIWTATLFSESADTTYAGLLKRHELAYMEMPDLNPVTGRCEYHWRYGYTGKFVAQYMNFAPNSIVFINACESDSIASLRQGFWAAKASVFCGWTKTVNVAPSNRAAEFLFDRLLGANASVLSPKESPPQRAFDVDRLWQDMKNRGYDTDPKYQSKLRVHRMQDHFGLLAPSIRSLFVLEHTDTLQIIGMFGSDPGSRGRVIVGGTELPVLDWQSDFITAFIPNTGAGSAGPVTVEVDGLVGPSYSVKRKSNVVNLTEWRGPITYTHQDAGSLVATITVDAHWRGDIHSFRLTPHTAPTYFPIVFQAADDSYGTVTAGGEYRYTEPGPDPTTYTWTWSGSDFVKPPWDGYPNWWVLSGKVMVDAHRFELMAQLVASTGIFETLVSSSEGLVSTEPFTIGTPFELYDSPPWIYIDMSNTWEIIAGKRIVLSCCSHNPDAEDVTHTISWPTILPYFPPDTTAAQ